MLSFAVDDMYWRNAFLSLSMTRSLKVLPCMKIVGYFFQSSYSTKVTYCSRTRVSVSLWLNLDSHRPRDSWAAGQTIIRRFLLLCQSFLFILGGRIEIFHTRAYFNCARSTDSRTSTVAGNLSCQGIHVYLRRRQFFSEIDSFVSAFDDFVPLILNSNWCCLLCCLFLGASEYHWQSHWVTPPRWCANESRNRNEPKKGKE